MATATVDTDIQKGGAYVVDACGNTHHFVGSGTFEQLHAGWFLHILLIIAVIVIIVGFVQGRKA
jgi:hypothetical protein